MAETIEFNPLDYAERDENLDKNGYAMRVVDIGRMYPAMIEYATAVITADDMSIVPRDQRRYVSILRPLGDLSDAHVHCDDVPAGDRERREKILETLRLWYTRLLKAQTGPGLGLKLTGDAAALAYWRLNAKGE